MQVLDKLDMNNITVQHVVLASIPAQDPPTAAVEVSLPMSPAPVPPSQLCKAVYMHGDRVQSGLFKP